jgi:addiction module RelE/StbE family toxin
MRIVWLYRAIIDLGSARAYIARDNPQAANRAGRRITSAVAALADNPAVGRPGRVAGTRELVIAGTSYIVPYRVRGNTVQILRVLHAARRWPEGFEES